MPLIRTTSSMPPDAPASSPAGLTSGSSEDRWAAARAAGGSARNVAALRAALAQEQDPRVREAIFTSLALINTDDSIEAVLPHVRSDDARLRTGALDALRAMPERTARHLPALLADADSDVRVLACDLCRALPLAALHELLGALLARETEPNVCAAAVDVLADCGGQEILPALSHCALRFGGDPFLTFSIKIAKERIAAQRPDRRE
ncbi:HEAT repeat domain-containing protein [Roseixanthobacter glucoisosaccharinicivorans]|uniref:HEAT repeat domain-containing protein n=1 Tax=Roseixanthobacter glucoisosaccharinicivorans TaxID=3119923 RepID=UPI003727F90E